MHGSDAVLILYCCYVPFLASLYLLEIYVICKKSSPFKSSFFQLFLATAVVDLLMVVGTFYDYRLPLYPLTSHIFADYKTGFFTSFRIALFFAVPLAQDILNCFVAANRLTSIIRTVVHEHMWKGRVKMVVGISYSVPFLVYSIQFLRPVTFVPVSMGDFNGYLMAIDYSVYPWYDVHRLTAALLATTTLLTVIVYAITARALKKVVIKAQVRLQDKALLYVSVFTVIANAPIVVLQMLLGFGDLPGEYKLSLLFQLPWMIDIKVFSAPILLLLVSAKFREEFMRTIKRKRNVVSPNTTLENLSSPRRLTVQGAI